MDGVLSSVSRIFFMLSLHVCVFASIPRCIETHLHTRIFLCIRREIKSERQKNKMKNRAYIVDR